MRIERTAMSGCFQIFPDLRKDARGHFVKTFHEEVFSEHGLVTEFAEEYYSVSHKGVLRGLHFQTPPHHHIKLIYCLAGTVMDAIVDLRVGSPTFKQSLCVELSAATGNMLYIAAGFAHGFYALVDDTIMQYKVTSAYAPENDAGIRWDTAGVNWPDPAPLIAARDAGFPSLNEFESPFRFEPTGIANG